MVNIDSIYSAMYSHLIRYKAGQIDLLDLLSEWERILGIQRKKAEQESAGAFPIKKRRIA